MSTKTQLWKAGVVGLAAVISVGCLGITAAHADSSKDYTENTGIINNPERGLFHQLEASWTTETGSGWTPLDVNYLRTEKAKGFTLVRRMFYIDYFKNSDAVSQQFLDALASDLQTARDAGVEIIPRFAYTDNQGTPADASPSRTVNQAKQIGDVLARYADVISVVELGFIGAWGEGYYTQNFSTNNDPSNVTADNWNARVDVANALLDKLPADRMVAIRYPSYKQHATGSGNLSSGEAYSGSHKARLAFFNDCLGASEDDYGSYPSADAGFVANDTQYVASGGETCNDTDAQNQYNGWDAVQPKLAKYHWSHLNFDYAQKQLATWGGNLDIAKKKLGYRFVLTHGEATGSTVTVQLRNDGWAAPFNPRPAKLVLKRGDGSVAGTVDFDQNGDARRWSAGSSQTIAAHISGVASGSYQAYLSLPGARGGADYAIQTANQGTWDSSTGLNNLGLTVTIP